MDVQQVAVQVCAKKRNGVAIQCIKHRLLANAPTELGFVFFTKVFAIIILMQQNCKNIKKSLTQQRCVKIIYIDYLCLLF